MGTPFQTTHQQQRSNARFQRPQIHSLRRNKEAPAVPLDRLEAVRGLLLAVSAGLIVWAAAIYLLLAR